MGFELVHKRGFQEAFPLGEELEETGVHFNDLRPGEVYNYKSGDLKWAVTILDQVSYVPPLQHQTEEVIRRPLVKLESYLQDGTLHDSGGGILYGLSLDGIGNLPVEYLPPDGGEFRTLVIHTLPNEESESSDHSVIIAQEENLPLYT